ncbi:MAG: DNA polymerase III subunit beta [Fimbriimonadaceae bacterium]|nr:DNA polymerase III subunit beta [Fimbriimonadaceae bacterium]
MNEAVSLASIAATGRTPLTILQNLRMDATGAHMRVLGCDGEMWVQRTIPVTIHQEGNICLQAKLLNDIVGSLPDGDVHLDVTDKGALLTEGNSEYRMMTLEPEDFPEPPETGSEATLNLPMRLFREAVNSVVYAVATDSHRPVLTGVLFTYDGTNLTLVATDTHRLAHRKVAGEGLGSPVTAIVPEKALSAILRMPIADDQEVKLQFGEGRLGVEVDGAKMVCQLLPDPYPNWERVVPTEFTRTWSVEVDQMKDKVKRTLIIARDAAFRVIFSGQANEILISAKSEERGEAKEELPMVGTGGDIKIAFNGKYVLDALEPIKAPGARVELTESSRSAVIRSTEDDQYFCVIMPMALG